MAENESALVLRPVVPLPIALYDSNGLLFELFDGANLCDAIRSSGKDWNRPEGTPPQPFHANRAASDSSCTT